MTRLWRESAWIFVFALATACSGKSSDLFEDAAGGDGSEDTGGSSNGGNGSSGDDGAGGSGATSTGGRASVTGGAPAGGRVGVGGTSAGGAITVGGAPPGGTSSSGAGGAFPGGAIGIGGTFGGAIGVGGAILGGKSSVGGSSPGGSGGVASVCSDPDGSDYKKRGTTTGSNGTFEDTCEDGDLIEYVCESSLCGSMTSSSGAADVPGIALPVAGRGGIAPPCPADSARVTQRRIACGGRCDAGTCFAWCPGSNDELSVHEVAGAEVVLDNDAKNARYRCEATSSTGDVDCTDPALEGETIEVGSLLSCSATVISFVARMPENASCDYRCSLSD